MSILWIIIIVLAVLLAASLGVIYWFAYKAMQMFEGF